MAGCSNIDISAFCTEEAGGGDLRITDFGADPTGKADSSMAFAKALRHASSNPAMVTLSLEGGSYRIGSPIVVEGSPCSFVTVQDGTLLASPVFPQGRYMLEVFQCTGLAFDRLVFESNHTGGGLRLDGALQTTVTRSFFHSFASHGIYGSDNYRNNSWPGHELIVESCWYRPLALFHPVTIQALNCF